MSIVVPAHHDRSPDAWYQDALCLYTEWFVLYEQRDETIDRYCVKYIPHDSIYYESEPVRFYGSQNMVLKAADRHYSARLNRSFIRIIASIVLLDVLTPGSYTIMQFHNAILNFCFMARINI